MHNAGGAVFMPVVPSHPVVAQMQGNHPGKKGRDLGKASAKKQREAENIWGEYPARRVDLRRDAAEGLDPLHDTPDERQGAARGRCDLGQAQERRLTFEQARQQVVAAFKARPKKKAKRESDDDE